MRRQITSFSLILCGLCLIFGSIVSLMSAPVASAMPVLAPSARPPVDRPPPQRPTQSGSHDSDDGDDSSERSTIAMGRLTGTIIDATTQAPVPGVMVSVAGVTVVSDSNGNYDTWLPVGRYTVGLMLSSQQGTDLQGPQAIDVRADDTTVQHLYFRSALAPTAVIEPSPTTILAKADPPVHVLPNTGIISTESEKSNVQARYRKGAGGASPHQSNETVRPSRLPVTSIPWDGSFLWLSLGFAFMLVGLIVGATTKRSDRHQTSTITSAEDNALLASLLETNVRAASSDDLLLVELLEVEVKL